MNVVVTGGGTIAPIDDVRYLANVSSGLFSARITEACLERGTRVWHVSTPSALAPFRRQAQFDLDVTDPAAEQARLEQLRRRWRDVRDRLHPVPIDSGTVADYAARLEETLRARPIDVVFLAMAVSDFEPRPIAGKIDSGTETLTIRCGPTPKVIQAVRDWAPTAYLVGFKLLSGSTVEELVRAAEAACLVNRVDLTVANDQSTVSQGRHTIHLVRPGQPAETFGPPDPIAEQLVDRAFQWASRRDGPPASPAGSKAWE